MTANTALNPADFEPLVIRRSGPDELPGLVAAWNALDTLSDETPTADNARLAALRDAQYEVEDRIREADLVSPAGAGALVELAVAKLRENLVGDEEIPAEALELLERAVAFLSGRS